MLKLCMLQFGMLKISKEELLSNIMMNWNRHYSKVEYHIAEILKEANSPLSLREITIKIQEIAPGILSGGNPEKSLYSIIYRREKRRSSRGHEPLLKKTQKGRHVKYTLNVPEKETAGKEILKHD